MSSPTQKAGDKLLKRTAGHFLAGRSYARSPTPCRLNPRHAEATKHLAIVFNAGDSAAVILSSPRGVTCPEDLFGAASPRPSTVYRPERWVTPVRRHG